MSRIQTFARSKRPTHPTLLKRTRLFQLLDSNRDKPLIWISGPAGSGKTTLLSSYIDNGDVNCFWYSCEAEDNDLATFFYHLRASVNRFFEPRKHKLPLLQPEYALGIVTFGKNFFRTLFSKIPSTGLLVIDDYHLIAADSDLHEIVRGSLDDLPDGLSIAILSRRNPPAIFARLRAESRLAEVTSRELSFTYSESEALVKVRKKHINAKRIRRWHEKTQGWIAGLILFIDRAQADDAFIAQEEEISHEHIFDYFAGELFDALDSPVKSFLAIVSLLKEFTASAAMDLTDNPRARLILRDFSGRELFTTRHGRFNPKYTFHPLLREFLRSQLEEMFDSDTLISLKKKAASILNRENHWADAAEIYQEVQDYQSLSELLKRTASKAIKQGRHKMLGRWIRNLPQPIIEQEPWLQYWLGMSIVQFKPVEAQPHFESALRAFLKSSDARGAYLSWAGLADSISFGSYSFVPGREWLAEFTQIRNKWPRYPGLEVRARVVFSTLGLLVGVSVDKEEMKDWVSAAERLLKLLPIRPLRVAFGLELAFHYSVAEQAGKIQKLRLLFRKIAENESASPMERMMAYGGLVTGAWSIPEREYLVGILAAEKALKIAEQSGVHVLNPLIAAQAYYLCLQSNDLANAKKHLDRIEGYEDTKQPIHRAHYHTMRSHLESEMGDQAAGLAHAIESVELIEEYAPGMMPEFPFRSVLGLQLIEMGRFGEGLQHLASAEKLLRNMDSPSGNFMLHCYRARSAFLQGDLRLAAKYLKTGLEISRRSGISGFGHWRPSVMVELFQFALEQDIESDHTRKLIRLSHLVPKEPPYHIPDWPWTVQIYALGGFKLYTNGELLTFKRKAQKKPIELLKAIIALGGDNIAIESLMDLLWPDSEGDAAKRVFDSTLHRLRALLGEKNIIVLRDGHLSLDFRRCWVDAFALHRALGPPPKEDSESDLRRRIESLLGLYQGEFLAGEQEPWILPERERLKNRVIHKLRSTIRDLDDDSNTPRVDEALERILEVFPDVEAFYELLMRVHIKRGRQADAVSTYRRCETILKSVWGVHPSLEMQKLYDAIRNSAS